MYTRRWAVLHVHQCGIVVVAIVGIVALVLGVDMQRIGLALLVTAGAYWFCVDLHRVYLENIVYGAPSRADRAVIPALAVALLVFIAWAVVRRFGSLPAGLALDALLAGGVYGVVRVWRWAAEAGL